MTVMIEGSTLSALLFNNLNSDFHQYGFLLGERVELVENKISDSQIDAANVNYFTYVSSFVPWPKHNSVYSRSGHVSDAQIHQLLENTEQTLVGWYSFRASGSMRPSLRESSIHSNLESVDLARGSPNDFLFFLCRSSSTDNKSTHTVDHGFMSRVNGRFLKIPMNVMNLGDTTRSEYKKQSNVALLHSNNVQTAIQASKKEFMHGNDDMDQIVKVKKLASSITIGLTLINGKVAESEAALGLLENEVGLLRQRVGLLESEEMIRIFESAERKEAEEGEEEEKILNVVDEEVKEEQEELERLLHDLGMDGEASTDCHMHPDILLNSSSDEGTAHSDKKSEETVFLSSNLGSFVNMKMADVKAQNQVDLATAGVKGNDSDEIDGCTKNTAKQQPLSSSSRLKSSKSMTKLGEQVVNDPFDFISTELKSSAQHSMQYNESKSLGKDKDASVQKGKKSTLNTTNVDTVTVNKPLLVSKAKTCENGEQESSELLEGIDGGARDSSDNQNNSDIQSFSGSNRCEQSYDVSSSPVF